MDGANNIENVANLILSILLSGHYKTYTIVDETGKVIKQKQKYTHPGRNFLGNLFENYQEGIKNPLYHYNINEIFTKHFVYTRHFVNFFRLSQFWNLGFIYELRGNGVTFDIAKTIGLAKEGREIIALHDGSFAISGRESRVCWLELGNHFGGMEHILFDSFHFGSFNFRREGHIGDFAQYGYETKEEIAELILKTINNNDYYIYSGYHTYRIETKTGETMYLGVMISPNGYIVNAHPLDRDGKKEELDIIFQNIDDFFNFKLFNSWSE
ncbi:MAG: hypothetical protein ACFFG0_18275 [Candidatus Thorarchaeota archaeon]